MLQDKDIAALDDEQIPEEAVSAVPEEAESQSLKDQMTNLIDDVRILAHAEIEYYRTKLSTNLVATKRVLLLFTVALVVGILAVIALVLGLLLILTEYFGPLAATAIATGSALLIATVTMRVAVHQARTLPLGEDDV